MKLPSIIPYVIGVLAGFFAFSDSFEFSRTGIWIIGFVSLILILLLEKVFAGIPNKKTEASK